jgi:hypothetical protein
VTLSKLSSGSITPALMIAVWCSSCPFARLARQPKHVLLHGHGAGAQERQERTEDARADHLGLVRLGGGQIHQRTRRLLLARLGHAAAKQLDERRDSARLADGLLVVLVRVGEVGERAGDLLHQTLLVAQHLDEQRDGAAESAAPVASKLRNTLRRTFEEPSASTAAAPPDSLTSSRTPASCVPHSTQVSAPSSVRTNSSDLQLGQT